MSSKLWLDLFLCMCCVFYFLDILKIFSLSLLISDLIMMCPGMVFFVLIFIMFGVFWVSWIVDWNFFLSNLQKLQPLFLQIFAFWPIFSPLFFWDSNNTNVRLLNFSHQCSVHVKKFFFLPWFSLDNFCWPALTFTYTFRISSMLLSYLVNF